MPKKKKTLVEVSNETHKRLVEEAKKRETKLYLLTEKVVKAGLAVLEAQ